MFSFVMFSRNRVVSFLERPLVFGDMLENYETIEYVVSFFMALVYRKSTYLDTQSSSSNLPEAQG